MPKQPYSPRDEIRPLFVNINSYTAKSGRSPLISLMFPTHKDMITDVNKATQDSARVSPRNNSPSFLNNAELEKIVSMETKARLNAKLSARDS